ncbi:MAG: HAD family hydrolase [Spirochaetia bacterium]|nr:HAD family hydrolase [Spirochaetia bacterium]
MNTHISQTELHTVLTQNHQEWKSLIQSLCRPLIPLSTDTAPRLSHITGIKAVVFDIYGTLLISGSGEVGSLTAYKSLGQLNFFNAFQEAGINSSLSPEVFNGVCSRFFEEAIQTRHRELKAQGINYPEVNILEIWQTVGETLFHDKIISHSLSAYNIILIALEYELSANPTWPMPNACETLATLFRHNYVMGIVSNAQFYTPLILDSVFEPSLTALGIMEEARVWSYKLGYAKPSTRLFASLLDYFERQWSIQPSEVLYVGNDMLNDIYTAAAVGCRTALFAGDQRSLRVRRENSLVQSMQPDAIITDMAQLLQILGLSIKRSSLQ